MNGVYTYGKMTQGMRGSDSRSNLSQSQSPVRQPRTNNRQSLSQSFNSIAEEPQTAPRQSQHPGSELGYAETPQRKTRAQPSYLNSTASRNAKTQRAQSANVSAAKPRMNKSTSKASMRTVELEQDLS